MFMRKTRVIGLGKIKIGGDNPVWVQSMTNTDTRNHEATLLQAKRLQQSGCEVLRVSVPDEESVETIKLLKAQIKIPIVADVHFNYRLAIKSILAGADGVRINPGNIGGKEKIKEIVKVAQEHQTCIRVGVNSGSLEKKLRKVPLEDALVQSALNNVDLIVSMGFENIKISAKTSEVPGTIKVYEALSEKTSFPLHIGVTESGTRFSGAVRSATALGILLHRGIGDTIRVSLAADPVYEVIAGFEILRSLGLRSPGPRVIACPTCARAEFDVVKISEEIEEMISGFSFPLSVAVMGCVVNGPGEAERADIGLVGSGGKIIFYLRGKKYKTTFQKDWKILFSELLTLCSSHR